MKVKMILIEIEKVLIENVRMLIEIVLKINCSKIYRFADLDWFSSGGKSFSKIFSKFFY